MSINEISRLQRIKDKSDLEDEQQQIRAMRKPLNYYTEPVYINYDDPSTNAAREADEYSLIEMRASIAATPKGLTRKMNKKLSRPTEEMIQEYNLQHQRKPYVDPENGKIYKYHPVEAEPILDQIKPEDLEDVFTDEQIKQSDDQERYISLTMIPQLEDVIENINEREKEVIDDINSLQEYPTEAEQFYKSGERKEKLIEEYIDDLRVLGDRKTEVQRRIEEMIQDIANYQHEKQVKTENRIRNEGKIDLVKQQNKNKLKVFKEQLNVLNSGSFNMEQMPYETDEEFKERLIAHSQIEAPAEALYDATVYASKEIRNKLKEVIRNDVIIDLIANRMTPQEKYAIMKAWGAYRKRFIETFGEYNPAMSVEDLVDFFTSPIGSERQERAKKNLDDEIIQNETETSLIKDLIEHELPSEIERAKPFHITEVDEYTIEIALKKMNTNPFFLKIIKTEGLYQVAISIGDLENSFRAVNKGQLQSFLQKNCNYSKEDLILFFETFGNGVKEIKETFSNINPVPSKKFQREGEKFTGWGIKHEDIPDWVPFGSIEINLKKLYYDNLLIVRTHKKHNISGFVTVKVCNKFVSIIMELVRGKNVHYSEIEQLPKNEKSLYDHLISIAKLHKKLDHRIDNSVEELKKKYEILVGEIEAGNNNPELIKDLKIIVNKLVTLGVFKVQEGRNFIKQL